MPTEDSKLKFQCIMCFSIGEITKSELGHQHTCSNCGKIVQLPNSSFSSGRVIADDFVIKSKLGSGAMGSVFLAHQLSMDREVALKVLFYQFTKDKRYAEEFNEEAKAAARVNHLNVVQSLAFGADQELLYMAMNYVQGDTFAKLIKRHGKMDIDDALNIVQQVAEGLHAAWTEMQLIHRDIKPANIIITDDGIAKISDFGLARRAHEVNVQTISGSPAYMSPEQFAQKPLDCRSDIYSLGITLFEALTGRLPFTGTNASAVAYKHINEPIPVSKIKPALPRNIRGLIKKMTAKSADERFQTPEELLNRIVDIRKRMAVDKAAVAGVHTMSIKRQSFNEPKRNRKLKTLAEYNKESALNQKKTNEHKTLQILAGTLCIVFIVLSFFSTFSSDKGKSKLIDRQLQTILKNLKNLEQKNDKTQNELADRLDKLATKTTKSTKDNAGKIDKSLEKIQVVIADNSEQIDKLFKKLTATAKTSATLSNKKVKEKEKEKQSNIKAYRDLILYNAMKHTGKGNYTLAKTLFAAEKVAGIEENKEWINQCLNDISVVEQVLLVLEKNCRSMIGADISKGKIIATSPSQKSFSIKSENFPKIIKVEWGSLNHKDLKYLMEPMWENSTSLEETLRLYTIYNLQFAAALELSNDKNLTDHIIENYLNRAVAEIDYLELIGKKVPKTKARTVEQFIGTRWEKELATKLAPVEEEEKTTSQPQ